MEQAKVATAKLAYNGIPPPQIELPFPAGPRDITDNLLKLIALAPDARTRMLFEKFVTYTHQFIAETQLTEEEWATTIDFLARSGKANSPALPIFEFISGCFGITAMVDMVHSAKDNVATPGSLVPTESAILGPMYLDNPTEVAHGESIMSGENHPLMFVEGRILDTSGNPISNALIDTWEADEDGLYDIQYTGADTGMDFRARVRSDEQGRYKFRAIVPTAYPVPHENPYGEILTALVMHNMRPSHLHLKVTAQGFKTLVTQLYPRDDPWVTCDNQFAVKESLVVDLKDIDEAEVKRRWYRDGGSGKLVEYDIVLASTPT